jgi:hypothetical protein
MIVSIHKTSRHETSLLIFGEILCFTKRGISKLIHL